MIAACSSCGGSLRAPQSKFPAMVAVHQSTCPGRKGITKPPPTTPDEMMEALGSALVIDKGRAPRRK